MNLTVSICSNTQSELNNLQADDHRDYVRLYKTREQCFVLINQYKSYWTQLRVCKRNQKALEPLPDRGKSMGGHNKFDLINNIDLYDILAKQQFIDALRESD